MDWLPPDDWTRILTIDAHTEGEPLRLITAGFPQPRGATMLDRRRDAMRRHDALRRALMWEPRGHADMYGCLLMPAVSEEADFSVLFMHNEGFSTMCGHGIIAVTKIVVEAGWAGGEGPTRTIAIDTPAGLVRATAELDEDVVGEVRFRNVPSFVTLLDGRVDVEGLGPVTYDLAFGGAYYAFVDAQALGIGLEPDHVDDLISAGRRIKTAVEARVELRHPVDENLGFLYGTVFVGPASTEGRHSRHVCVFAEGEVDRSPTGTAVSGRLAILQRRGQIDIGEEIVIESILGGRFTGRILEMSTAVDPPTVIPEVGGRAFVTGRHEFVFDPQDPWNRGFLLR